MKTTGDPLHSKRLSLRQRLKKGLMAAGCLVAAIFTMLYGLIFSTNFITQLNPLNSWVIFSASVISYGLVALAFIALLMYANRSMTKAFSGIDS